MDRIKGDFKFPGNFEVEKAAPLDARQYAETQADLLTTSNWTALDGAVYTYVGMMVAVHSDSIADNNGLYVLINADYTQLSSWLQISGGTSSGGNFTTETFPVDTTILTNGYIDLTNTPTAGSITLFYDGLEEPIATGTNPADGLYTIATNRITFNDISNDLYIGGHIDVKYNY